MCKYSDSHNFNYCGELDDLTHIFATCSRIPGLFQLTHCLIRKWTPTIDTIPVWWYIIGMPAGSGLVVYVKRLGNCFFCAGELQLFTIDSTKTEVLGLIV